MLRLGKKKLELGIAAYKSMHPDSLDTFSTIYHPFQLNPDDPKIGIDKREYYNRRFGANRAATTQQRLEAVGKDIGINFSLGGKTGKHSELASPGAIAKDQRT